MIKKLSLFLLFIGFYLTGWANKKPNVLFFLIDDLGYMDLSHAGSKFYETLQIDQLAKDGVRFTRANMAAPRCVSSRVGLMTGQVPYRHKIKNKEGIRNDIQLMPEAFKAEGYKTFFAGKWHLGHSEHQYPDGRGFDINIGGCDYGAPHSYFFPYHKKGSHPMPQLEQGQEGEYLTDRLTQETKNFIRKHQQTNPDQPFFALVSHYGVHTPLQAKADKVKRYKAKLDKLKSDLQGDPYFQDQTGWVKAHQNHPIYAAMIESIDESVGSLREELKNLGIDKDTIIVFTSDHGGLSTTKVSQGQSRELATSNLPLRTGKGWLYEGGLRVPFLLFDPSQSGGRESHTPINGTDIYPSLLDLCQLPLRPEHHLDGYSFAEAIRGHAYKRPQPIIYHYMFAKTGTGNTAMAAVIDDPYKLVILEVEGKISLYHLNKDPGESQDLSLAHPEIKQRLLKLYQQQLKDLNVAPLKKDHPFYKTTLKLLKDTGLSLND